MEYDGYFMIHGDYVLLLYCYILVYGHLLHVHGKY